MSEISPEVLAAAGEQLKSNDLFETVEVREGNLIAVAADTDGAVEYRVLNASPNVVGLYTPDRWLSQSIEADLVHTGDKIEELIEEELVDLGLNDKLDVRHYRNDAKEFVYESQVGDLSGSARADAERLSKLILAYAQCFAELGDLAADEQELV